MSLSELPAYQSHHDPAHAEDGELEPAVGFDYDAIDRNTFGILPAPEPDAMPPDAMEAACVGFTRLMEWLWQDGMKNSEGLQIRAAILCWVFLSQLRPLTMTQMAAGFGKKKQSLGRWVDDYKRQPDFPRIAHMKH